MGVLVNGEWVRDDAAVPLDLSKQSVTFQTPQEEIAVEGGERYFLYVTAGCPYAARPWMVAEATGLTAHIRIVRTFPGNSEDSWFFSPVRDSEKHMVKDHRDSVEWDEEDPYSKAKIGKSFTHLHQLYTHADPKVTCRVSVPVLLDTKTGKIISCESIDIAMILMQRFAPLHDKSLVSGLNLCPSDTTQIMEEMKRMNAEVNSKVYKTHLAATQEDYETYATEFFGELDRLESTLAAQPWLLDGTDNPSILDLQLFATMVRFDSAYHSRFRLTQKTIRNDYPHLWDHTRRVFQIPGVSRAVDLAGIRTTYYYSVPLAKKAGITVAGLPHDFERALTAPMPLWQKRFVAGVPESTKRSTPQVAMALGVGVVLGVLVAKLAKR